MKLKNAHLVVLFFSLFLGLQLKAQGWKQMYPAFSSVSRATQTPDGGFLLVGTTTNGQLGVIKTDLDGKVLVTKTFSSVSRIQFLQIAKDIDNNCLIAIVDTSNTVKVLKITAGIDSIWFRTLPLSIKKLQDFQVMAQGNVGLVGLDAQNKIFFSKLNPNGEPLWTRTANDSATVNGFTEEADGSIFLQINNLRDVRPQLYIFDKNGTALNAININTTLNNFFRFTRLRDENLVMADSRFVIKFKSDGRLMWGVQPFDSTGSIITDMTPTSDGGVVVLGYGFNQVLGVFTLAKLDATGKLEWRQKVVEDAQTTINQDYTLYTLLNVKQAEDGSYYLNGNLQVTRNGANTREGLLIKTNSKGVLAAHILRGQVVADANQNCALDNGEKGIQNWIVKAEGGNGKIYNTATDATGRYEFQLDSGRYKVTVFAPNNLWEACFKDSVVVAKNEEKVTVFNILAKPVLTCTGLRVTLGTPLLRRCFESTYRVDYCNNGTAGVKGAYVEVTLDTNLTYVSATRQPVARTGQKFRFNVGDLDVLACGAFEIKVKVPCDTPSVPSYLGRTACTKAHIFPDSICPSWRGARIEASGKCEGDSIKFELRNIGQAATVQSIGRTIIEDQVVFLSSPVSLNAGQTLQYAYKGNGKTYRLIADQERGYPTNQTTVSAVVEGCGVNEQGDISRGFVLQLPEADGDPFVDIDCQEIIGSLETNTKIASPVGYQAERRIEPNQAIDYMIRFQNVGNDTAFNVIVRDTLTNTLDPTTIELGASSRPYTFELIDSNILKFTFRNILLTDSLSNKAASLGFVKFRVNQKPNLKLGTQLVNKAAIFFDFNKPIVTSRTFHTVGTNFLISAVIDQPLANGLPIKAYPNPASEQTTFELQGDLHSPRSHFRLYDVTGRLLRAAQFEGKQYTFEREDLSKGVYFFSIENDGKRGTGKLIIQ